MRKIAVLAAVSGLALMLAACDGKAPQSAASAEASLGASGDAVVDDEPDAGSTDAAPVAVTALDTEALTERRDPERLLRYYTNAVRAGDWGNAAKAWSLDAQMTSQKLANDFGAGAHPKLAIGKGDMETAAGTSYYEAPVVVDYGDGRPSKRGIIVLTRVNDVPGASEQQLNWRIQRTSILP
ncbi:hypothetical protein WSK_2516 [Novosphingobium sp. Rr 2-17]|uniref:hypothetical protein n=1 Tax=Novosphingobium sp. Rr 2-17 TaxID=555793 RepID=UPI0002697B77|nr:hypothetical protein [Novosphingobium sp. Rr 2-17]EIZ78973.1 hypothetical protein WSK_2516 [Novosphingobium sp. Rr 2-17]